MMALKEEERELHRLLRGRTVKRILRNRRKELVIEFSNGTRLFVDGNDKGALELSVT